MIPIKKKHKQVNFRVGASNRKRFIFGILAIGAFLLGFVFFLALYRFGVVTKWYNSFF